MSAWTERTVAAALYRHFTPRWVVITQVTTDDEEGAAAMRDWWQMPLEQREQARTARIERRCDVLLWRPDERMAVEIKVSRQDLAQDVADPAKQAAWRAITHRHAYAVPDHLEAQALASVPATSGVVVVRADAGRPSEVRFARRAPKDRTKRTADLPDRVHTTLMHRLGQAEAVTKALYVRATTDPGELQARLDRLQADYNRVLNEAERARRRADDWRKRYHSLTVPDCRWCGQTLTVPTGRRRALGDWAHSDPATDSACAVLREAEAARLREIGERYAHVPIEPRDPAEDVA